MAEHNDTGRRGEELAQALLLEKGYWIEATNWRTGKAEIDIIARREELLVFVEVKTRTSDVWSKPDENLRAPQIKLLGKAANVYMERTQHDWEIRFDLITVVLHPNGRVALEHFEDAFFPGQWKFSG